MLDLHKALADIESIRSQVARGTQFRGYGSATVALTGVLAIVAAGIQSVWLEDAREQVTGYLVVWIGTAVVAAALIGAETITRSRRLHSGLADEMIYAAIEQLIPVGVAGALLTFVLVRFRRELVDAAGPVAALFQPGNLCIMPAFAESVVRDRHLVSGNGARLSRHPRRFLVAFGDGHSFRNRPIHHVRYSLLHDGRPA